MTGIAASAEGGLTDQAAPSPPSVAEPASGLQDTEPVWTVELTDEEREHAAEVIEKELLEPVEAASIQAGTQEFFNAAEVVEGALPSRARAALAALRRGTVPVVLLRGLPFDEDPGPTPIELGAGAETVRRGNAWIALAVRKLGDEFGYAMEKKGSLVHNIYPTKEGASTQSNASFKVELGMHTENAFHPIRPDWVVLYCVRAPEDPPATRLAVLDEILVQLTDDEIEVLRDERFNFSVVDSHRVEGEEDIALRVAPLTGSFRRPAVRWHETLEATDDVAARAARTFTAAAHRATRRLQLHRGDLLAFGNEDCLHGRDRFPAALDGTDRWLLRGYSLRDLNRTAAYVAPARPRVTRIDLSAATAAANAS
jgi:alpha-ketoglutarate-dependent taurine dioxygenase